MYTYAPQQMVQLTVYNTLLLGMLKGTAYEPSSD